MPSSWRTAATNRRRAAWLSVAIAIAAVAAYLVAAFAWPSRAGSTYVYDASPTTTTSPAGVSSGAPPDYDPRIELSGKHLHVSRRGCRRRRTRRYWAGSEGSGGRRPSGWRDTGSRRDDAWNGGVTIDTPVGRTRIDLVEQTASGERQFVEVKNGPYARLNPNQTRVFAYIRKFGGTPVGQRAAEAGFTPREPIGPTPVTSGANRNGRPSPSSSGCHQGGWSLAISCQRNRRT